MPNRPGLEIGEVVLDGVEHAVERRKLMLGKRRVEFFRRGEMREDPVHHDPRQAEVLAHRIRCLSRIEAEPRDAGIDLDVHGEG